MVSYKIHLLRTGTTGYGEQKRFAGQSAAPVSGEGLELLRELKEKYDYPNAQMVFTSPMERCVQTADELYPETYTVTMESLADMDLGDFTGYTFEELKSEAAFMKWLDNSAENPPPGGEDSLSFTQRVVGAIDDVFRQMMDSKLNEVVVITHGGVIMSLLAAVGLPRASIHEWAVPNGTGYTLMMNPMLWMQNRDAEVFGVIPREPQPEEDTSWFHDE